MKLFRQAFAVLLLSGLLSQSAVGQVADGKPKTKPKKNEEGPVYADPNHVDDDYHLQGEYRGWQRETFRDDIRQGGLQVIALGQGQFSATNYAGGLPGEGWFGCRRRIFEGGRESEIVLLNSFGEQLQIADGVATLTDARRRELGKFHRVQRRSPTMGAQPPPGAVVLFDGTSTDRFANAAVTPDGLLKAGTETVDAFTDFRLHAEFRLPYKPQARGQSRGNSGFYLQSRYEVQVLDSFGLKGVENECGALYKTRRPDFNMCFPPLVWQTYDIDLTSPRFDAEGKKLTNMRISVWHNGVLIHNNAEIPNKTGNGQPEGSKPLPTKLQDHRNPVVYRNLWIVDKSAGSATTSLASR